MPGGRQPGAADRPSAVETSLLVPDRAAAPDLSFVVGVVDTGVVVLDGRPHPFIAPQLAASWQQQEDLLPSADEPLGRFDGHGTFVAGLIARQAPGVTLDVRNALDKSARSGPDALDPAGNDRLVAAAIEELAEVPGLRLLNLSFFGDVSDQPGGVPAIREALRRLFDRRPEVLVVTSSPNSWRSDPAWPAALNQEFDNLVAVAALDVSVLEVPELLPPVGSFSTRWPGVDGYASGVRVLGPTVVQSDQGRRFGWVLWSGSSFAAASTTGMIALLMRSHQLTAAQAWQRLSDGPGIAVPDAPTNTGHTFGSAGTGRCAMADWDSVIALVELAREGDQDAWDRLVDRYAPLVWAVCRRHRLAGSDAEDVAASVWLRLVERLDSIRQPAALPGWLATTARHECLHLLRAGSRQVPTETERLPDEGASAADEWLLVQERQILLRAAFGELSQRCRELLSVLFEDPPPSYAEASTRLGLPVGGIGPTRQRCLASLRANPLLAGLAEPSATGASSR